MRPSLGQLAQGRVSETTLGGLYANALAELDAAGVALYSDQHAIDSTTPMGRAMKVSEKIEHAIRRHLNSGHGILKVAGLAASEAELCAVQQEMARQLAKAAWSSAIDPLRESD